MIYISSQYRVVRGIHGGVCISQFLQNELKIIEMKESE
jgi:hypothetical protein